MSKSTVIRDAFRQASQELGVIKIKGRGHAPRIVLSSSASRYAAEGSDNWEYLQPGKNVGKRRYFPVDLVKRAAEIAGFPIESSNKEVPIFRSINITKEEALIWHNNVGSLKPHCRYVTSSDPNEPGRYIFFTEQLGHSLYQTWCCHELGAQFSQFIEEVQYEQPKSLGDLPIIQCNQCKFYSREAGWCAVNPINFLKPECADFEMEMSHVAV